MCLERTCPKRLTVPVDLTEEKQAEEDSSFSSISNVSSPVMKIIPTRLYYRGQLRKTRQQLTLPVRRTRNQDSHSVLLEKEIMRVKMETEKLRGEKEKLELENQKLA